MKRIALSLALGVILVAGAQAQQVQRGNDAEIQQQAPARDYAAEAQNRLQSTMDVRRNCLLTAGLREKDDFIVRSSTKVSVRDGAWTAGNKLEVSKCLQGAN
jgi:hypothetical protein